MFDDTIAAISTARGVAALAIVRVSGPKAITIVADRFSGNDLREAASHTAHVGSFRSTAGETVDQVVVTVFKAPGTATGEDLVEISCHGGDYTQQLVLRALLDGGARLARPGEFTERAFLNGKLDLAQAEAVADLIHARSTMAHRVSVSHLTGRYSKRIENLRARLLETCSLVELELDFAEEDVEFADRTQLDVLLAESEALLSDLLGTANLGALIRDGVRVVIGGRPNAGKSTLLNALLGADRAIVSPIPGTTRDQIEADIELLGIRFTLVDTAGLRETSDAIEAEGVQRTHAAIATGSILLFVYDASMGLQEEEKEFLARVEKEHPELPTLLIGNKADLAEDRQSTETVVLSAKVATTQPEELDPLHEELVNVVTAGMSDSDASTIVVNERHRRHLQSAMKHVRSAGKLPENTSGDVLASELRAALHDLGAITGQITTEDILGEIFSRFCIGK